MRPVVVLVVVLVGCVLAGCGTAQGTDPAPHSDVTGEDSAVRIVGQDDANLLLHVSNQSFDDEEVRLTVVVDGVTVVDGDFHVEDQHHWVSFPLALPAGEHEISAESDSGARLSESFEVPEGKKRYAVLDHWTDGGASLSWEFYRQPVAFA